MFLFQVAALGFIKHPHLASKRTPVVWADVLVQLRNNNSAYVEIWRYLDYEDLVYNAVENALNANNDLFIMSALEKY